MCDWSDTVCKVRQTLFHNKGDKTENDNRCMQMKNMWNKHDGQRGSLMLEHAAKTCPWDIKDKSYRWRDVAHTERIVDMLQD